MKKAISCLLLTSVVCLGMLTTAFSETSTHYVPGTYTGTGNGMWGKMTVNVTFTEDRIEKIELDSMSETEDVANSVFEILPAEIIANQSLDVDTVTGATFSSRGALNAIKDAVTQAGANPEDLMTPIAKTSREEVLEVDIVIVGGGTAGLTAAVEAANSGAKVILVEANGYLGGSTGFSGGMVMIPATQEEAETLGAYDVDELIEGMRRYGTEFFNEDIVRPFVENCREDAEWVADMTDKDKYHVITSSVHYEKPIGNTTVTGPAYTTMVKTVELEEGEDEAGNGFWIISGLKKAAQEAGVAIYTNTRAIEILDRDGVPCGIQAQNRRDDIAYTIYADSVVLACGGFGANRELTAKYHESTGYFGSVSNDGFGIIAAEKLGAKIDYVTTAAYEEYPGIANTIGGVYVDRESRVLDKNNEPIPGLFSAGEMATIEVMDPPHFTDGTNLSWAIYSGRRAGASAAEYSK